MSWKEALADIDSTDIQEASFENLQSEEPFVGAAVELAIEAGSLACVAANIFKNPAMHWSREEAIVGGHVVRMYKLLGALLDQTCKERREITAVLSRLIFECIVNLRYIVAHGPEELARSYISYSLQHELRLINVIEGRISERGGVIMPIEERMLRSIGQSFEASALSKEEVAANWQKNWGGLNLFEKANKVGLAEAYLAFFGGGSHSVHGNWQDLLEYQLEKLDDNTYRPEFNWHSPRPQILETIVILIADALADYVEHVAGAECHDFLNRLEKVKESAIKLGALHETFLTARQQQKEHC